MGNSMRTSSVTYNVTLDGDGVKDKLRWRLALIEGLLGDIEQVSESLRRYPWTTLAALKGDVQVLRKLEETEELLRDLKKALSR
jgi:hypothetical protein